MANKAADFHGFLLGDWRVEPALNRITQGRRECKLESRVMALLVYLAGRPGQLVTREELEEGVWEGRIVGYDALTNAVTKLRKALGDSSRHPSYIETVPKKGYRLVAAVTSQDTVESHDSVVRGDPAAGNASTRGRYGVVVSASLAILLLIVLFYSGPFEEVDPSLQNDLPTIAVLEFRNLDGNPDQDYLGNGITADLATALSRLSGVTVISPFSTRNYSSTGSPIRIAHELDVHYLLTGSLLRSGERLRINARLVNGVTGEQIWAQTYDRELRDLFAVQDDITSNIVAALAVNIATEERNRLARRYTTSIEAYEKFLQGQVYLKSFTAEENLLARELFQHAIDLDPDFARAYGAMAMTYAQAVRFRWQGRSEGALGTALALANRAIAIDPELYQAYWVRGYVYLLNKQYEQSITAVNEAIRLNPSSADAYVTLAIAHSFNGEPERSIALIRKAMRLNPQYPAIYPAALGQAYYLTGRYEEAIRWLREAIEKNNNFVPPHVYLVASLMKLGRGEEAHWEVEQLYVLDPGFDFKDVANMFLLRDQAKLDELLNVLRDAGLKEG